MEQKVLIVEDLFLNSEFLRIWVTALGHEVCGVARAAEKACEMAAEHRPDVILMDLKLDGERDGVDAALEIAIEQDPAIVYVTASEDAASLTRIMTDHPFRILIKPVEPAELMEALEASTLLNSRTSRAGFDGPAPDVLPN